MIKIRYTTIDRFSESRSFKTLSGAQAYAQKWVGKAPTLGTTYAVSDDGVGKIVVEGATLAQIFPATVEAPKARFMPCTGSPEILQYGGDCNCMSCCAYEVSFEAKEEALERGLSKEAAEDEANQAFADYVERQTQYHMHVRATAAAAALRVAQPVWDDEIPF